MGRARSPRGGPGEGPGYPPRVLIPRALAPADANEERPLPSARVEKAGDGHASAGAGAPADPPPPRLDPRRGRRHRSRARRGDPRAALVAVAPRSPAVADALVRIARSINGWERLADARFAAAPTTTTRRGRDAPGSSAIASLVARAYEHRVGERPVPPPARPRRALDDGAVARVSPRRRRVLAS